MSNTKTQNLQTKLNAQMFEHEILEFIYVWSADSNSVDNNDNDDGDAFIQLHCTLCTEHSSHLILFKFNVVPNSNHKTQTVSMILLLFKLIFIRFHKIT